MDDNPVLFTALASLLILIGFAGTVLPALPGPPLVFGGLWILAWQDHYTRVPTWVVMLLGALTVLALVIDLLASLFGAKKVGASKFALIGSALGTLIGLSAGLVGVLIGPFIGAFLGEYLYRRDAGQAGKVGIASWLGFIIGTALKLAILFMMLGIFAVSWWW
ncbi:DUF456 domain-containing protein [Leeia sp. TBRC 13508]|uniref:DUF456 domain-containing protein n=1 Tax=Leeia speluncae TaxID=2884804 RepID=A0ABS8D3F9_9NEIS|nr:DUF456 domain-containing protein [Leeia speluncae]MCB6182738.1 DUF456 domain-containing protein [Leeia speluncae]